MTLSLVRDRGSAVAIGSWEPGSEEWWGERRYRIGGSEIGPIIGVGYSTYYKLFHRKLGNLPRDPSEAENERLYWGRVDEAAVRERFARDHSDFTVTGNLTTYAHPDRPWQMATPDGFVADETGMRIGLIEVKITEMRNEWGEPGTDQIPPSYLAQVLWQLDVMGLRRCWLPVKFGAFDYKVFYVDLDHNEDAEADLAVLIERGREFIDRLENGPWPLPGDGSDVTYEAVRDRHPEIDGTDWEATPEDRDEYLEACRLKGMAEKAETAWKSLILEQMGTAQHAVTISEDGTRTRFAYRTARKKKDGTPGVPFLLMDNDTKKRQTLHGVLAGEEES